jgi:MarR family transcriptional regulator, organic hydroperoxide resistance regulator
MPMRVTSVDTSKLDPVLDFLRLLWSIEHGLQRLSKRMNAELGVTGPQRLVLRVVGRFPGISAGELAHVLRLHPSTITGILQRLVDRGLLERTRHPHDSRRARLHLKRQAHAFTQTSSGTVEQAVKRALKRTGASSAEAARSLLTALAEQLDGD